MNFWDSSAILPLLVSETSTPAVRALYDAEPEIVAWWGTPAECVSALARLEREGALDAASVAAAIRQLGALGEQWHEVQPVDAVRLTARCLLRAHRVAPTRPRHHPGRSAFRRDRRGAILAASSM